MNKVWIHTSTLFIEQLFQHRFRLLVLEQVGRTWFKPKLAMQRLGPSYIGADLRAFNYRVRATLQVDNLMVFKVLKNNKGFLQTRFGKDY